MARPYFSNRRDDPNFFLKSDKGYSSQELTEAERRYGLQAKEVNRRRAELGEKGRFSRKVPISQIFTTASGEELDESNYFPKQDYDYEVREYNEKTKEYEEVDLDTFEIGSAKPVPLTDFPTSSTNSRRPYTLAAGWKRYSKQNTGTLTVLFRDGTLYNYYQVPSGFWSTFQNSLSKGLYINKNSLGLLNKYPNGPADMSLMSERDQDRLRGAVRAQQLLYEKRYSTPRTRIVGYKEDGTPIRRKVGRIVEKRRYRGALGKNTATANKPPKR